jgi:hypothetical protein
MKKLLLPIIAALLVFGALGFADPALPVDQPAIIDGIADTPESKEIMKVIEKAYDIEAEAAYTFDLKKFPTVFINDPRFDVIPATVETIRELTQNPSLESAGYLDYKMAYYGWRRDAILHSEAIYERARRENRGLTEEEKASLVDPQGRIAPAREETAVRTHPISFLSIEINDDIAIAIINTGATTSELTLVLVDKKWYIAANKILSVRP